MFEVIIKVLEKEQEDHKRIGQLVEQALTEYSPELKVASKDDEGVWINQIWQIGKPDVDPSTWQTTKEKE